MNPDIKQRWIEALESGKYRKGKGALRRMIPGEYDPEYSRYCCLGVLCELAVRDGIIDPPVYSRGARCFEYDGSTGNLPDSVRDWAGLKWENPEIKSKRIGNWITRLFSAIFTTAAVEVRSLAGLNDATDSFKRVIKVIKKEF